MFEDLLRNSLDKNSVDSSREKPMKNVRNYAHLNRISIERSFENGPTFHPIFHQNGKSIRVIVNEHLNMEFMKSINNREISNQRVLEEKWRNFASIYRRNMDRMISPFEKVKRLSSLSMICAVVIEHVNYPPIRNVRLRFSNRFFDLAKEIPQWVFIGS